MEDAEGSVQGKSDLEGRVDDMVKELEAERKRSEEYLTRLKYLQADLENYEKRVKREREEMVKMSSERIIKRMLGILDEMELAVAESRKMNSAGGVVKGVEMILTNLVDALKEEGVVKIEAVGNPFDPLWHEAVSFVETDEVEDNMVVQELRKGYLLNGKVIRTSMVEVARKTVKAGSEPPRK